MKSTPLDTFGVEVTDVDLRTAHDDAEFAGALRQLLADHGVVVLRNQSLDDEEFTALLRGFGELMFTEGETAVEGHPDLNVVSNVGRETPPRSVFHVDTSYVSEPPSYTALRAVTVPDEGGQTLFVDQYASYQSLSDGLRLLFDGRSIRHALAEPAATDGAVPEIAERESAGAGVAQETEAWHPAFRPHPLTRRLAVYVSTPQRCVEVSGMSTAVGNEAVRRLYEHCIAQPGVLRHSWATGDVVIWDNACVLHKADHTGVVGDRVMHRGMVAGYGQPDAETGPATSPAA